MHFSWRLRVNGGRDGTSILWDNRSVGGYAVDVHPDYFPIDPQRTWWNPFDSSEYLWLATKPTPYFNRCRNVRFGAEKGFCNRTTKVCRRATLFDPPGIFEWARSVKYEFETVAVMDDATPLASIKWGFIIQTDKSQVFTLLPVTCSDTPSADYNDARKQFNRLFPPPRVHNAEGWEIFDPVGP